MLSVEVVFVLPLAMSILDSNPWKTCVFTHASLKSLGKFSNPWNTFDEGHVSVVIMFPKTCVKEVSHDDEYCEFMVAAVTMLLRGDVWLLKLEYWIEAFGTGMGHKCCSGQ